ncbi:MAG: hypothetical protein A3C53_06315 [Omnitrophica WOR_2 bacterium RIFCSPHIGHO2_02_FULL_68_15]|nr:MAG: hypothetical protein A3C53_06315 [Omnitrophica WOR_2 bacterium RIFCSPHIGHO2_02_FULL_68_15]
MITEIGIVAGEIWHYLEAHAEAPFSEVVAALQRPRDIALMSLGWLSREGHVVVRQDGQEFRVALRR